MEGLRVLLEDNHLIVVNKRSGDIVQGDKTGDEPLPERIKAYIKHKYGKPGEVFLGVIHRIDRPVSGVVLFARTSKALSRMTVAFKDRDVQKTYLAAVEGVPPDSGKLIHYLKKDEKSNKAHALVKEKSGYKRCELSFRLLHILDNYSIVEVKPITGRHHQIRAQLAAIGHPIKGDVKYGARRGNPDRSIHLHAVRLEFNHPVRKEPISILADLPDDPIWNNFSYSGE